MLIGYISGITKVKILRVYASKYARVEYLEKSNNHAIGDIIRIKTKYILKERIKYPDKKRKELSPKQKEVVIRKVMHDIDDINLGPLDQKTKYYLIRDLIQISEEKLNKGVIDEK